MHLPLCSPQQDHVADSIVLFEVIPNIYPSWWMGPGFSGRESHSTGQDLQKKEKILSYYTNPKDVRNDIWNLGWW